MFDKSEISIPCGKCGSKTKKTVAWLKRNSQLTCACGARITIDNSQFVSKMNEVDKAVDDFKRSMRKFGR